MDENKVILPDEYKEKGWAKSILNDAGEVDMGKVFSKIDGQESLLGKKQIPGKNSTEEEWAKFNAQITADYEDGEYDAYSRPRLRGELQLPAVPGLRQKDQCLRQEPSG